MQGTAEHTARSDELENRPGSIAPRQDARETDLASAVWRFFCSMRLALYLIIALVLASLAGALLIQVPAGLSGAEYAQWLNEVRPRYGVFADAFSLLGLFNVFNIWYFRLLLGLLTLSVVICTLDRWPRVWKATRNPSARVEDAVFERAANRASFAVESGGGESGPTEADESGKSPADAARTVEAVFQSRGYRVRSEVNQDEGIIHLHADRNWFARFGTFLNHFGLVLILAGSVAGGLWGFRDREFAIPEGSTRAVGHDTKLSMKVESFADEYYPEGPPKDYRSEVVLYDNGTEVRRATIRVNEPLSYDGIRFYQSYFGPAMILQVKAADGKLLYDDGVALAWRTTVGNRPAGSVSLLSQGLTVHLVGPSSENRAPDPQIPAGKVRLEVYRAGSNQPQATELLSLGQPKKLGDLEYTFVRERQFTGLQVTKDPGSPVIWVASALMVLGTMLAFYFPHRRLWARVEADEGVRVRMAAPKSRAFSFSEEFSELAEAIHAELAPPVNEQPEPSLAG